MDYKEYWDLSTIPTDKFKSEYARRTRALAPHAPNINLQPCEGKNGKCGEMLTATQRRKPCPLCGYTHPRVPAAAK